MGEETQTYRTRRAGGLTWTYREGYEDLIAKDYTREALRSVDENRVRFRGRLTVEGQGCFVKVFKPAGAGRALKSIIAGHVAKKEFSASRYLSSRGLPTPEALAVGLSAPHEDHAVIVFQEIPGAVSVRDLFLKAPPGEREVYLNAVAAMTARLHRASFHHRDYHGGNLLVTRDRDGSPQLWIIDLHRSSFPRDMSGRQGVANIAAMLHSLLPALDGGDIDRFLARYRVENPAARWDVDAARREIGRRLAKIERRRLKSRTKRCFKNSSGFSVSKNPGWLLYMRRGMSRDGMLGLIGRFDGGEGRLIKTDRKATIALVPRDGMELCVKAYRRLGPLDRIKAIFGRSRGHNSWRAAQGLRVRGFDTPAHLCLAIRRRLFVPSDVYLVVESIAPRLEMDRFILRDLAGAPPAEGGRFAVALGSVIGSLHREDIYHRDLKATNIAVGREGDGFSFSFLDLDSVSFRGPVPLVRRAKNLAQILLSTPPLIDAVARGRLFDAYLAASGGEKDRGKIARLIRDMIEGRDILYVSERGDVVEKAQGLHDRLRGG
jgi:tRNA A-37 threonylcarbamoyl transferase component Bud32